MFLSRGVRINWKKFFLAFAVIYVLTTPFWLGPMFRRSDELKPDDNKIFYPRPIPNQRTKIVQSNDNVFQFYYKNQTLYVKEILTAPGMPTLKERLTTPIIKSKKYILSESSFHEENLGGCPDWSCEITNDSNKADAFINSYPINKTFNGYTLFSSQESPVNFGTFEKFSTYNMSIGFRHDSPTSSPYGYTVLLNSTRPLKEVLNKSLIMGKKKSAVWFVSHCNTNSRREDLVTKLKSYIEIDIYGACGDKTCAKGDHCENQISTHYHFYLALENSICQDYITEKLWNQGYGHTVLPIVLKRKLVEAYVPPNSFIAFDDYKNMEEMGKHLKELMENKIEYMKYFEWRKNYAVIYLNGLNHDQLERPLGLCQLCRLLHQSPLPQYRINDIDRNWYGSCEKDGQLAEKLLGPNRGSGSGQAKKQDIQPIL